jgi:hypothetical protein
MQFWADVVEKDPGVEACERVGGGLGLTFHGKRDPVGPPAEPLTEALGHCVEAAWFLEAEPAFAGKLGFATGRVRLGRGNGLALGPPLL